jgi:hypothetical protein
MDALYILGFGSPWENNELRFSLRSLERHVRGIDRVFVVGENPGFLSERVVHHYATDPSTTNKEFNIAAKIYVACEQTAISDEFFFLNDDHIFAKDVDATAYPYYWKGDLFESGACQKTGQYGRSLRATAEYLRSRGAETRHFDLHTPIVYNKKKFLDLRPAWQASQSSGCGFVVKSTYANLAGVEPGPRVPDLKFFNPVTEEDVRSRIADRHVFSFADTAIIGGLGQYLYKTFPDKSRFEI